MQLSPSYRKKIASSVGMVSVVLIAYQMVIIQILSISQWHHFAFMVISMAMLGFGAAGTCLALFNRFFLTHFQAILPLLLVFAGVSMAATAWLIGLFGDYDVFLLFFERRQAGMMLFSYLAYCLPFFWGGLAITLVFYHQVERIGTFYFFNLAGSALGGICAILLFWLLPLPLISPLLALIMIISAWLLRTGMRYRYTVFALSLVIPLLAFIRPISPNVSEYKAISGALQLPEAEITYERFSPYGLLQRVDAPTLRYAPALSLTYRGEPPVRSVLYNNGEYFGTLPEQWKEVCPDVTEERNDTEDRRGRYILDYSTRGLPYAVKRPESMLVVHSGTGNDIAHGRCHGVPSIVGIEPHRQAVDLLKHRHPEWTDSLFLQPGIEVEATSARTWLAREQDRTFDLVVMPILGTFGGNSGIHALEEQYHLTIEAFQNVW
ncbi:hypothetical protein QLX67_02000, partial [Balneolaceae bacterium ANBcel3]|nr:hypothetical protein [Balneolaceae bacterium ANBcel3]